MWPAASRRPQGGIDLAPVVQGPLAEPDVEGDADHLEGLLDVPHRPGQAPGEHRRPSLLVGEAQQGVTLLRRQFGAPLDRRRRPW